MKNKIELKILFFILIEAVFLLFFFKESLLNILVGSILGLLLILLFQKFNLNNKKVYQLILLIIAFILSIIILKKITLFINYNILKHYPFLIIMITFLLTSFFLATKGYHSYIKSIEISFYFFIIIKLSSIILTIPNLELNNINYQLFSETNINLNIIYIAISYLLIYLFINNFDNNKISIKTFIISIFNNFIIKVFTILSIGITLLYKYDYPYINVLKKIQYLDFIERMEGILSFEFLIVFYFIFTLLILLIKYLVYKIFNIKKDKICNIILSILSIIILLITIRIY